jgi:hypothetical protein
MTHNNGNSDDDSSAKLRSYHADLALYLNARDRLSTQFESCALFWGTILGEAPSTLNASKVPHETPRLHRILVRK